MKKLLYILPILLISFYSCDDFLDRDAENEISNEELFSTVEGAGFALSGVYASLTSPDYYGQNMLVVPEFKSGNIKFSKGVSSANINKFSATYNFTHIAEEDNNDDTSQNFYKQLYETLNSVNNIINYLPAVETTNQSLKNQIMGEAMVIRALIHFDLSRLYAQPYLYSVNGDHMGVVTLTETPDVFDQPSRSKLYQTYDQIEQDLLDAIPLLTMQRPGNIAKANINSNTAQALLARVYLYKKDWNNAIKYSSEVIKNYTLVPNGELVESWLSSIPSQEDIWVLNMSNRTSRYISEIYGVVTDDDEEEHTATVTKDLYELYSEGDKRLELFKLANYTGGTVYSDTVSIKFSSNNQRERFIPVVRLSEMYLTRAEASAENKDYIQARADLEMIMKRANPSVGSVSLSGQALIDEIMKERRRELCLEGHTYFDFIRKGKGIVRKDFNGTDNKNIEFPNNNLILPIPYHEVEYNDNMEQNEGYESSQDPAV